MAVKFDKVLQKLRESDEVGVSVSWGDIGGTLSSQTDLDTALSGKLAAASNLSDLADAGAARTNLGLGTSATVDTGTSSGNVPVLDGSGKLSIGVLPGVALNDTFVVADQTAMLALTAETGDIAVRTDLNKTYILKGTSASTLADWQELLTPTDTVQSVFGRSGTVTAQTNDYTWAQIDKTTSSLADITTRNYSDLSGLPTLGTLSSQNGTFSGGGTLATGGFTLTVPATGTAALVGADNNFSASQTITGAVTASGLGTFTGGLKVDASTNTAFDALYFRNSNAGNAALTRASFRSDAGEQLIIDVFGSGYSGSISGINYANLVAIRARTNTSGLMIGTESTDPFYFITNNSVRATLDSSGNFGIGGSPTQKLHVIGTGDLSLRAENASYKLDFGVDATSAFLQSRTAANAAAPLYFYTGSTAKMVIDSTGSVGIGTTTAGEKLTVVGRGIFSLTSSTRLGDIQSILEVNGDYGTNSPIYIFDTRSAIKGSGGNLTFGGYTNAATTPKRFGILACVKENATAGDQTGAYWFMLNKGAGLDTENPVMMILGSSGNVGIGTTTPSYRLHVNSSASTTIAVDSPAANNANLYFNKADVLSTAIYRPANTDDLRIYQGGVDRVAFSSGNVGIGTTAPGAKLDVVGTYSNITTPQLVVDGGSIGAVLGLMTADTLRGILRADNTGSIALESTGTGGLVFNWSGGSGDTAFYNGAGGALVTIKQGGNVGIGTVTPTAKLHIDQSSTTAAKPVLTLDQAYLSEEFIRFVSTVGAGNPIDTAAIGTYYGKVRVYVEGVGAKFIALYNS